MINVSDCYTLSNGVKIPCVGLGTWKGDWQTPDTGEVARAVCAAVEAGFRHIDTASCYLTEEGVGLGVKECGINRSELFVTTKLWNDVRGYRETIDAFHASMKKLGLKYLDLYLIHWPNPAAFRDHWQEYNAETWRAFEDLYKAGDIRAIGVSNFYPHHLDALMKTAQVAPMVNQIRLHPGCATDEIVQDCRRRGILLEGYSPLGTGNLLQNPEILRIAEKYGKSAAQICLRWSVQREFIPLPKSVTPQRIQQNAAIFDFEISEQDMEILTNLQGELGTQINQDNANF